VNPLVRAILLGIGAGFVAGLFGVGGGVIIVPGLVLGLGLDQHRAHATSLAIIVVAAATGLASFAAAGEVDWSAAATVFIGSSVGALVVVRYLHRIPALWLARAFVVLVLLAATRLAVTA